MGIKGDRSRVIDVLKYNETIERVYGVRIKLPPIDSEQGSALNRELLSILETCPDAPYVAVGLILAHLRDNYSL
jgi:hypothetical protein